MYQLFFAKNASNLAFLRLSIRTDAPRSFDDLSAEIDLLHASAS